MKMQQHLTLILILVCVAGLQSCTTGKSDVPDVPRSASPIPVKIISAKKSKDTAIVKASGILTTEEETIHAFRMGGVLNSVLVREGDPIRKGQVLASLDLTEINAQVAQAELNLEKAERDLHRLQNLYQDSVVTLEQLENAQTAFDVAAQQLTAAEFNKRYAVIIAPEDGYVLKKFISAGEVVGVGDPVIMTNAPAAGSWILKVGVSAKEWSVLRGNEEAVVTLDAFPDKSFNASVVRKSERHDPQSGLFTVELKLHRTDAHLATGMFGSAKIKTGVATEGWRVPYEAILDAHGHEGFVFVTKDNKTVIKQAVTIQSFNDNYIRISDGLDEGDMLIVSGSAYLTDQATISVVK